MTSALEAVKNLQAERDAAVAAKADLVAAVRKALGPEQLTIDAVADRVRSERDSVLQALSPLYILLGPKWTPEQLCALAAKFISGNEAFDLRAENDRLRAELDEAKATKLQCGVNGAMAATLVKVVERLKAAGFDAAGDDDGAVIAAVDRVIARAGLAAVAEKHGARLLPDPGDATNITPEANDESDDAAAVDAARDTFTSTGFVVTRTRNAGGIGAAGQVVRVFLTDAGGWGTTRAGARVFPSREAALQSKRRGSAVEPTETYEPVGPDPATRRRFLEEHEEHLMTSELADLRALRAADAKAAAE